MHHDDLKVVWFCHDCGSSFMFKSDVEDHSEKSRHSKISKFDLTRHIDLGVEVGLERRRRE